MTYTQYLQEARARATTASSVPAPVAEAVPERQHRVTRDLPFDTGDPPVEPSRWDYDEGRAEYDAIIATGVQGVRAIPAATPCYPAEERLFALIEQVLAQYGWVPWDGPAPWAGRSAYPSIFHPPWAVWDVLKHRCPQSLDHRRGPRSLIERGGPGFPPIFPCCEATFTMVEEFVRRGLGFETRRPLGPHVERVRLQLWADYAAHYDATGVELDAHPAPDDREGLARLMLRRGAHVVPALDPSTATVCVAEYLFAGPLADLPPAEAVREAATWTPANWRLRTGERTAIEGLCRGAWNRVLLPAPPTRHDLDLVCRLVPLDGGQRDKQIERRLGALRFWCWAKAQARAWERDTVEFPTERFRERKDPTNPRSIIGYSTTTYRQHLLDPLLADGALSVAHEAAWPRPQCTVYRLHHVDWEGEEMSWEQAEARLAQ